MLVNTIFITSSNYYAVKKSLADWLDMYEENIERARFQLYKADTNKYIVLVDSPLDNERFVYLVNYLVYPIDTSSPQEVIGFTMAVDENIFPKDILGKQVLLFIPSFDNEYDVIYWTTHGGYVYKTDFRFKTVSTMISKHFIVPEVDLKQLPEPENIY